MKKLEEIPKDSIFKVPDGYFEQLPSVIQTRMASERKRTTAEVAWSLSVKFALPVVVLVVALVFWLRPAKTLDMQLSEIEADQIEFFLEDAEPLAYDEAPESDDAWSPMELDELERAVFSELELSSPYESDNILDDIDLENL